MDWIASAMSELERHQVNCGVLSTHKPSKTRQRHEAELICCLAIDAQLDASVRGGQSIWHL